MVELGEMSLNPFSSWTCKFVVAHLPHMTLPSVFRYRSSILRQKSRANEPTGTPIRYRLRRKYLGDIWLREGTTDLGTFDEIFVKGLYRGVVEQTANSEYILDLGSNVGLATRYFASSFPKARICSIEPDPDNFTLLERNVSTLLASGHCRALRVAAWSRNQVLNLSHVPEGSAFDSVTVTDSSASTPRSVEGLTITEILRRVGFPRIDILKMDIEGAESEILRGDVEWLERTRSIAVEFHGNSRSESRFDALMSEHGFKIDDSHRFTVIARR